jgi:phenylacetate-CoA ligase
MDGRYLKTFIPQRGQIFDPWSLWFHPRRPRGDLVAYRNRRLRGLIRHAYYNVPYYRKLFDREGLKPRDIRTVEDLRLVPVSGKADLQFLPADEVVARGLEPGRLRSSRTSGVTGEPFTIFRGPFERLPHGLLRRRAVSYLGLKLRDVTANVTWVRPFHHLKTSRLGLRSLGLCRQIRVDCMQSPGDILSRLADIGPDVLAGYAGTISLLAQAQEEGPPRDLHPRFIMVGAEVLTPTMRRRIERAFSAPAYNLYCSHEFGMIAWECLKTGEMHTSDDGMILEVQRDGRPAAEGEQGEVIATNLHSFVMPLIRYRSGDLVTQGSETCACGEPFSTIRDIRGRMIDYFPLPDGSLLHPYEIVSRLDGGCGPWFRQYQIIQEKVDRFVLMIVPEGSPTEEKLQRVKDTVGKRLGEEVELEVRVVPRIEREPHGKHRVSRSLVRSNYEDKDL